VILPCIESSLDPKIFIQKEKNRARHFRASPGPVVVTKNYSDRRKFKRSCFWLDESEAKFSSTSVASEPLLE